MNGQHLQVSPRAAELAKAIRDKTARVAVIGLGYVGLPLAMASARAGFAVTGIDIDPAKCTALNSGSSYIEAVTDAVLAEHVNAGRFSATSDRKAIAQCRIIVICVPTPLTRHREPDLSYIRNTAADIAQHLRPGTLVVLESTTYPGTTREVLVPILASSGLKPGEDFFAAFSPEREDPGNTRFNTVSIPKVVAGEGPDASALVQAFYGSIVDKIVPVSSAATAEAVKITENIFRAVNIALVNELKVIYDAMGIDVWEVIDAAKTKPFGFQAFYPGPGLGGHCIPIDPFYLTWKAREFGINTRFIELAGEINTAMPARVISRLELALGEHLGKPLKGARILLLGLAYKKNVSDVRESPAFALLDILKKRGAECSYHDPHVPQVPPTREHAEFTGLESMPLSAAEVARHDAVLLATDHDGVDYGLVADHARLVVDTRNAFANFTGRRAAIVKA